MLRICIDGFNIALPHGTGIATYGHTLLSALRHSQVRTQVLFGPSAALGNDNTVNQAVLFDSSDSRPQKKTLKSRYDLARSTRHSAKGRDLVTVQRDGAVIWPYTLEADTLWAARDLYKLAGRCFSLYGKITPVQFTETSCAPAVMHWTTPLPLRARGIPNIVTIHDMIPLRLPYTTRNDRAAFMALHRASVDSADHVAVVSEATRQDVIALLGVSPDKVSVTYQSVTLPDPDPINAPIIDTTKISTALASTFALGWKDYFLHFGAVEPKKNLGRLVEAYLASGAKSPLVIVGGRGWLREDELTLLEQFHRDPAVDHERIRMYEYMSRDMLLKLVRGAKATLFPSLYEGFGLPALEAMGMGTAVLSSDRGALPEVVGDAALVVDPTDITIMAHAIRSLDNDESLRQTLEAKGRLQATRFSMQAYRQRLADLYAKVGVAL